MVEDNGFIDLTHIYEVFTIGQPQHKTVYDEMCGVDSW